MLYTEPLEAESRYPSRRASAELNQVYSDLPRPNPDASVRCSRAQLGIDTFARENAVLFFLAPMHCTPLSNITTVLDEVSVTWCCPQNSSITSSSECSTNSRNSVLESSGGAVPPSFHTTAPVEPSMRSTCEQPRNDAT